MTQISVGSNLTSRTKWGHAAPVGRAWRPIVDRRAAANVNDDWRLEKVQKVIAR